MEIRNVTGQPQVLGGVHLPPDLWLRVPEQVRLGTAMAAWNMRIVEVRVTADDPHALWREEDGLHLFWQSPFSLADGYGTAAENMVWALKKLGVHVHARVCWFDASKAIHAQTRALLAERIPAPMKVGVCMSTPPDFPKLPTAYRVGYTMYEADDPLHVHPEWRHGCEHADLLVVPSGYCRDVFGRFYRRRIEVAPLVVHPDFYLAKRRVPKDTFTFVSYGTLSGRKGPLETMDAFLKAFPKDTYPHVRLAFKTRLGVFGWGHHQLPPNPDPERITIHDTGYNGVPDWSRAQLIDWLLGADALLFLSKGEGFGMPPREAMATGLPAIFTNHTGMAEVADARYAWPVRWKEEKDCPLGGVWRPADTDDAIDIMRYVVEHREDAYDKAVRGAEWFIREHGEEAAARRLLDVLEDIDPVHGGACAAHPREGGGGERSRPRGAVRRREGGRAVGCAGARRGLWHGHRLSRPASGGVRGLRRRRAGEDGGGGGGAAPLQGARPPHRDAPARTVQAGAQGEGLAGDACVRQRGRHAGSLLRRDTAARARHGGRRAHLVRGALRLLPRSVRRRGEAVAHPRMAGSAGGL